MIQNFLSLHAEMSAVLTKAGLGAYTNYFLALAVVLAMALLRGLYVAVAYRDFTDEERAELMHDPHDFHLLDHGKKRRW